ncbi:MAG: alanine racemase [Gemmatimonadaceae bacterium]|nr:alanine racemase [Gemmatimonadaceae bacterium]
MPTQSSPDALPRAWVEVDLDAVVRNAKALANCARVPLIPMVKADAYGLGAVRVAQALESLHPLAYGVSSIVEGEELRRAGITRPVLVFTPTLPSDLARLRSAALVPTLASREGIATWAALGGGDWHLAIDTGMHRAGIGWRDVGTLAAELQQCPPSGAFTHFHSAELDDGSLEAQEQRFREALSALPALPPLLHADNSAAIVRRSPSPWQAVRPGVFLYGVGSGNGAALQPEPVAHLRARVVETRSLRRGETVSYDATWTAAQDSIIATVGVGYGDGYRRSLGNVGEALVSGGAGRARRAPVAGTVTMDMLMLDVTGLDVAAGDVVTLLGRHEDQLLTAEDVAARADLSPYELLTGLRQRLLRLYTERR